MRSSLDSADVDWSSPWKHSAPDYPGLSAEHGWPAARRLTVPLEARSTGCPPLCPDGRGQGHSRDLQAGIERPETPSRHAEKRTLQDPSDAAASAWFDQPAMSADPAIAMAEDGQQYARPARHGRVGATDGSGDGSSQYSLLGSILR